MSLLALRVVAIFLLCVLPASAVLAQAYPARSIRLVVPFTPGGSQDVIGRLFAQVVGAALGQSMIVENKAGAGGLIAAQEVVRAMPDGYTLLLSTGAQMAIEPSLNPRFDLAESVLAVTLTNINPVAHAAMALANFTRIERGEAWPQYHYLTPAVARLVEALDAERRSVAGVFGQSVTTIEAHFQRSFDVEQTRVAEIAAELHRRRGGPPGPISLDTRFVLEDVPFGLVFNSALARVAGIELPVTTSASTVLSTLYARDFAAENPLIEALHLTGESRAGLLARCVGKAS